MSDLAVAREQGPDCLWCLVLTQYIVLQLCVAGPCKLIDASATACSHQVISRRATVPHGKQISGLVTPPRNCSKDTSLSVLLRQLHLLASLDRNRSTSTLLTPDPDPLVMPTLQPSLKRPRFNHNPGLDSSSTKRHKMVTDSPKLSALTPDGFNYLSSALESLEQDLDLNSGWKDPYSLPDLCTDEVDRILSTSDSVNTKVTPTVKSAHAKRPTSLEAFREDISRQNSFIKDSPGFMITPSTEFLPHFLHQNESQMPPLLDNYFLDQLIPLEAGSEFPSTSATSTIFSSESPIATSGLGSMDLIDSEGTVTGSETEMYKAAYDEKCMKPISSKKKRKPELRQSSRRLIRMPKHLDNEDILTNFDQDSDDELISVRCSARTRFMKEIEIDSSENDDSGTGHPTEQVSKRIRRKYKKLMQRNTVSFGPVSEEEISNPWWPKDLSRPGTLSPVPIDELTASLEQLEEPGERGSYYSEQFEWRRKRQRKQLELWQFILKRLESGHNSAFKWVNKASGVFRIIDTRSAAYEWGKYRNNVRMDYEKMARAMRFYYKDSMLRKARQQLHFQFAMPFIEWFRKHKS
ncbi:E74-like factor 3 [Cichlidogyrus casuarinus]|uniref:E74-like factor 3 n=1 Tax=Cichlidogyrus casuarinus TaxID=1844966 RepID=A0ABD2Q5A5_9PLAT